MVFATVDDVITLSGRSWNSPTEFQKSIQLWTNEKLLSVYADEYGMSIFVLGGEGPNNPNLAILSEEILKRMSKRD